MTKTIKKFEIVKNQYNFACFCLAFQTDSFKNGQKSTYVFQKTFMNFSQPQFWSTKKFEKGQKKTEKNILGSQQNPK